MSVIYPPVYAHLWPDGGNYYLNKLYSIENLKSELKDPDSRYYFVEYNEETIGILKVVLNCSIPGGDNRPMVKLHRIYLSPEIQGKGLGKQLLNWIEEKFCKDPRTPLWLEVMDSQEKAIRFYENCGFIKAGTFSFDDLMMKAVYRGMFRMIKEV
ncbi:GNAT family N-acetyltransferase [Poritiphilus flavus]|uniref:GNAT family N-acetyltransferase n=1 Tax=Poritiphilus flavus TaxID=2697053 RepID=A0A6L9E909_9FLAO|nr:GNAT family N-acetyltransferase [Poritiphilus flavus]NAS11235.1 GNAT family N-acetyltransferase [Poritiphilus flavus]